MTDINTIYKSYKQRLISINSRNSSFFLGKVYARRHIDLVSIAKEYNNVEDIYDNLLMNKTIRIKKLIVNENELIDTFNIKDNNYKMKARNIMPQLNDSDFNHYETLIEDGAADSEINLYIRKLVKKYQTSNNQIFKDFTTLSKSANTKMRETGKTDLYLGFPFIEGKIDNKDFRAPIVLHRIDIKQTGSEIKIKILNEGRMLNPVFLLSYLNQNDLEHKRFDFELPETLNFNYIKYAIKFLKDEGINVSYDDHSLEEFLSYTKKEYRDIHFNQPNNFKIKNNAIIGMFPISNQNIYNDIDYLDKNPLETSNSLDNFIRGIKEYDDDKDLPPKESDIKYITPLDWSQRIVVKNAIENDLVIEGPPGTGKSQTIVNIIINLLLQDKKVLVISEKVAAIEVVYNRLGRLREHTLIIKDHIRNKNDFFNQIVYTDDNLSNANIVNYDNSYDNEITNYLNALKEINNSNFYNEFSYEEVLSLYKDIKLLSFGEKNKAIINYTKDIKDRLLNITYETNNLLSDNNIKAFKSYKQKKDIPLFKQIGEEDIYFIIDQINSNYTYKQIQYNYYLYNLEKDIINHKITKENKFNIKDKQFNYYDFTNYINDLFIKYNDNKEIVKKFNTNLYNDLNNDISLINLSIKWKDLSNDEKVDSVLDLRRPKVKRRCFFNLFKRNIPLTNNEELLISYLNNYYNNFDVLMLTNIKDNLDSEEIKLFKILLDHNISNKDELTSLLLSSNIIKFDDISFDNLYEEILKLIKDFNIKNIKTINELKPTEYNLIKSFIDNIYSKDDFIKAVIVTYVGRAKISKALNISKYLKDNRGAYEEAISNMNLKYDESSNYVYNHVKMQINNELKLNSDKYDKYTNLVNQTTQKRKRSVRSIFKRYDSAIRTIYPVILMTPDVVSALFEMEANLFDYVIFDEASQMFVERAVPAIHRSKSVIVAGDSKQLKPSSVFTSRFSESDEIDDDDTLSDAELEALDKESLLDMAKGKYQTRMLKVHYRSLYEELIAFSSRAFYDDKLFFASNIKDGFIKDAAIEVVNATGGLWSKDNTNMIEALEVVRIVKEILLNRKDNETIGIITFNIRQKNLIQELLEKEENSKINKEFDRINLKTLEDESLFVKNIENVQGDERDIIIFSIGYARDIDGNISAMFGTLNQSGGENRLNVAITRAKKKIYVVKSIKASELRVNVNNPGPLRLKQYLHYVEHVSEENLNEKNNLLDSIYKSNDKVRAEVNLNSNFIEDVYDNLRSILSKEYLIKPNINIGGYNIDFAIYNSNTTEFILGIKCDGYEWNMNQANREIDFHSVQYLESRGWNIHTILSTNWDKFKSNEMNKIRERIDEVKLTNNFM